jgi:hypothetical protein
MSPLSTAHPGCSRQLKLESELIDKGGVCVKTLGLVQIDIDRLLLDRMRNQLTNLAQASSERHLRTGPSLSTTALGPCSPTASFDLGVFSILSTAAVVIRHRAALLL